MVLGGRAAEGRFAGDLGEDGAVVAREGKEGLTGGAGLSGGAGERDWALAGRARAGGGASA